MCKSMCNSIKGFRFLKFPLSSGLPQCLVPLFLISLTSLSPHSSFLTLPHFLISPHIFISSFLIPQIGAFPHSSCRILVHFLIPHKTTFEFPHSSFLINFHEVKVPSRSSYVAKFWHSHFTTVLEKLWMFCTPPSCSVRQKDRTRCGL